jgi:hypothetical protein
LFELKTYSNSEELVSRHDTVAVAVQERTTLNSENAVQMPLNARAVAETDYSITERRLWNKGVHFVSV